MQKYSKMRKGELQPVTLDMDGEHKLTTANAELEPYVEVLSLSAGNTPRGLSPLRSRGAGLGGGGGGGSRAGSDTEGGGGDALAGGLSWPKERHVFVLEDGEAEEDGQPLLPLPPSGPLPPGQPGSATGGGHALWPGGLQRRESV